MSDELKPLTVEVHSVSLYATEPSIYFFGGVSDPYRHKSVGAGYLVTRLDARSVDNLILDDREKAIAIALLEHSLKRLKEED